MKIAYSYGRFSTLAQGESGKDSQRRQLATTKEWCKQNGYTLSEQAFFDAGKSGYKGENIAEGGDLLKFLKLVEDGHIPKGSVLVIDSYDRFSRMPPTKSLTLFLRVIGTGIKLVFAGSYERRVIDDETINKEPNLLQFIIGEMIRSFRESEEKSRKIKEAKQAKTARMRKGEIVRHNNMPKYFSYDKVFGRYVHNSNTPIVKDLVKGILSGKSLYFLADDLNKREVKTFRRGFEWSGNSVRQILRNRILTGEFLGNKDFVPAIIDTDTYTRVQVILNQNKFIRGKKANLVNIFKGLCFCSDCGKSMAVASQLKDGITYRYLRCSKGGRGQNNSCKNHKHIKLDLMEEAFFLHFLNKHPYELLKESERKEVKEITKQLSTKQTRLDQLNKDFEFVMNLIGQMEAPELQKKLLAINTERGKLKVELDQLNLQRAQVEDAPEDLRPIMCRIIDFGAGPNGTDKEVNIYADTMEQIEAGLKDNAAREQTRLLLPSMIGKITVDTSKGQFFVYTRMGKLIFKSHPQKSNRNRSERWKKSLKEWKVRRLANGKIIDVRRKVKVS